MNTGLSIKQQVEQLAGAGEVGAAVELLEHRASGGEPDALFALGAWLDAGQHLPRDRGRARACFQQAAAAGHAQADPLLTNFLATGTGGPREWQAAVDRLRKRAPADARARFELSLIASMELDDVGDPPSVPERRQLSESPWVQQIPALFTERECAFLAAAAAPFLRPATVVDNISGKAVRNPIRTSHTALFSPPLESPAVHALNRRLAAIAGTNVDQGEPLQVLRYELGQEHKPHIDAIPSLDNQRVLTTLVYLNDGYTGGETHFVATGTRVQGRKGAGLIFRNVDSEGRADKQAAHCGMPVTHGVKLLASRWIRERSFAEA